MQLWVLLCKYRCCVSFCPLWRPTNESIDWFVKQTMLLYGRSTAVRELPYLVSRCEPFIKFTNSKKVHKADLPRTASLLWHLKFQQEIFWCGFVLLSSWVTMSPTMFELLFKYAQICSSVSFMNFKRFHVLLSIISGVWIPDQEARKMRVQIYSYSRKTYMRKWHCILKASILLKGLCEHKMISTVSLVPQTYVGYYVCGCVCRFCN